MLSQAFPDELTEVGWLDIKSSLTRVSKHPAGEFRQSFSRVDHTAQHLLRRMRGWYALHRATRPAQDTDQQIIKIVSNAARQPSVSL